MKVRYLLFDAFGIGGTVRTVFNAANFLVRNGYDVEIASIMRWRRDPFFPLDRRIPIVPLTDTGRWKPHQWSNWRGMLQWAARHVATSRAVHPDDDAYRVCSRFTDQALHRYLRSFDSGVLITTRPSLNLLSAECAANSVVRIGQEHEGFVTRPDRMQRAIRETYSRLDAVATLTEGDADRLRQMFEGRGARIVAIPNAVPDSVQANPSLDEKLIIAVGRLTTQKGFDFLLDAFRRVSPARPQWKVKIFGAGPDEQSLRRAILEAGLSERVSLEQPTTAIGQEFGRASICAVSSRWEGFPMVIVEAMSCGLPVVSFDCPTGPREIIQDGHDGVLVKLGDVSAFANGLARLMDEPDTRKRMGKAARLSSRRFALDLVGRQWIELIESLHSAKSAPQTVFSC